MFATLSKLFAAPKTAATTRLAVEALDRRDMMAAGIASATFTADQMLVINGSAGDDRVDVRWRQTNDGNRFEVVQGSLVQSFPGNVRFIVFNGNAGNDSFRNLTGTRCQAAGGDGDDSLSGGSAKDVLLGGAGNDVLTGNGENDVLLGDGVSLQSVTHRDGTYAIVSYSVAVAGGYDTLTGGDGDDLMCGDGNSDRLYGGNGYDCLTGGDGDDQMYGEAGDDRLDGGFGFDWMSGGSGNDVIVGGYFPGADWVTDAEDRVYLSPYYNPNR